MNLLIYAAAVSMVFTKFLDCYTTAVKITHIEQEKNPLARWFMRKVGVYPTIWIIFALTIAIVLFSTYFALIEPDVLWQIVFLGLAGFISGAQFAIAHTNYYGKLNFITRFMLRVLDFRRKI